jgi:hypothetical protein
MGGRKDILNGRKEGHIKWKEGKKERKKERRGGR